TQGPIPRDLCKRQAASSAQNNCLLWLWVPAFAGTTLEVGVGSVASEKELRERIECVRPRPRDTVRPSCAELIALSIMRTQGRPGAGRARGPPAKENAGGRYHRSGRERPAS